MRTLISAGTIVMALSIVSFDAEARRAQQVTKVTQCRNEAIHGSGSAHRVASKQVKNRWRAQKARAERRARRAAARRRVVKQKRRRLAAASPYGYAPRVVRVKRRPADKVVRVKRRPAHEVVQVKRRPVRKSVRSNRYVVSSTTPRIALPSPVRIVLALR